MHFPQNTLTFMVSPCRMVSPRWGPHPRTPWRRHWNSFLLLGVVNSVF